MSGGSRRSRVLTRTIPSSASAVTAPPPFHSYPSLSILARHVSFRTPSTVDQPAGYVRHAWKRLAFACAAEGVLVMFMYNLIVHELIGEVIMKWTTHNGGYGSALTSSAVS